MIIERRSLKPKKCHHCRVKQNQHACTVCRGRGWYLAPVGVVRRLVERRLQRGMLP